MIKKYITFCIVTLLLFSCSKQVEERSEKLDVKTNDWQNEVKETINLFGHRNWIVIADAAYPKQSHNAIKTIVVDADQLEVVNYVNDLIKKSNHINAHIFVDKEMVFVNENDAPGISEYKTALIKILNNQADSNLLHEAIIKELDDAADLFQVLIIKTPMALPYTSVFFQLECGYWTQEAETNLRNALNNQE